MANYKPVIGLEIHVELKTKTGMFCQCRVGQFEAKPNSHVCPICLGLPGALPVPNKKAIEWTIKIAKALNCTINHQSKFDRKHYTYPDLPKGYQISQYDEPIAVNGKLNINKKSFRIRRVHIEEDTGKLIHSGKDTLIDFNRSGTPLVEIVTEPDFDNGEDVKQFLEELQVIIRYLDVSDADMEKGSMRLEPNISLKEINEKELPKYKVEIKNINSFRFVKQAIEYELKRQKEILEKEETPKQETRGFDEKRQITYSQRSKEYAPDYRYFPEPDIPPMVFSDTYIKQIISRIPELPAQKVTRYVNSFALKLKDAFIISRNKKEAEKFEQAVLKIKATDTIGPNDIANVIINKKEIAKLTPDNIYEETKKRKQTVKIDDKLLNTLIKQVIIDNKKAIEDYKKGKTNAIMFLVGQVMKKVKGKLNVGVVISKLKTQISKFDI